MALSRSRAAALLIAAVLLSGCSATSQQMIQPREGRSGLQGTGTLDGQQVVVAQGLPELVVGTCRPTEGHTQDLCFISNLIDGRPFVLTIENPDALVEEGETLPVGNPPCGDPESCEAVTDVAIVSLKIDTDPAVNATSGTLRMTRIEPFQNYVGEVNLRLPNGRFTGSFDVVPRPD
ncbi:MAG: hypothetical protein GEU81_12570 [Nitriliruptorales bacterium]|nr:hypothetical protein [Nitriliruptorales bacterium]